MLNKSKLLIISMFVINNALAFDNTNEDKAVSPSSTHSMFSSATSAFSPISRSSCSPLINAHMRVLQNCTSPIAPSVSPIEALRSMPSPIDLTKSWADIVEEEQTRLQSKKSWAAVVSASPKVFFTKK